MKDVRITVVRMAKYTDLMEKYENPIEHACELSEGQVFICKNLKKPDFFCESAFKTLLPFIEYLAFGGEDIYDGWMKNKKSALLSCNDGFRPVSFLIEAID